MKLSIKQNVVTVVTTTSYDVRPLPYLLLREEEKRRPFLEDIQQFINQGEPGDRFVYGGETLSVIIEQRGNKPVRSSEEILSGIQTIVDKHFDTSPE